MMNEEARGVAMPRVWVLVSVNVVRKFLMFADVLASYVFEPHALVPAVKPTKLIHAICDSTRVSGCSTGNSSSSSADTHTSTV